MKHEGDTIDEDTAKGVGLANDATGGAAGKYYVLRTELRSGRVWCVVLPYGTTAAEATEIAQGGRDLLGIVEGWRHVPGKPSGLVPGFLKGPVKRINFLSGIVPGAPPGTYNVCTVRLSLAADGKHATICIPEGMRPNEAAALADELEDLATAVRGWETP